MSEYAVNYQLFVPEAGRDEFITVDQMRKSSTIVGRMNLLLYFRPSSIFYPLSPGVPAGVFTYDMNMTRIPEDVRDSEYPFIWDSDGPVELDKYFGY